MGVQRRQDPHDGVPEATTREAPFRPKTQLCPKTPLCPKTRLRPKTRLHCAALGPLFRHNGDLALPEA